MNWRWDKRREESCLEKSERGEDSFKAGGNSFQWGMEEGKNDEVVLVETEASF